MVKPMTSDSTTCPRPPTVAEPRTDGRRCVWNGRAQCRGLRAQGMTLFEILVAVALLGAVMAITLPLVVSQTQRLTYGEIVAQIERHAAVVRSDAQRQSEAIWFEARWIDKENAWGLGIAQMARDEDSSLSVDDELAVALLGDMETALADDSMDQPPMFADEPDSMSGFEVRLRLPKGYRIERTLPEDIRALAEQGGRFGADDLGLEPGELLDSALDEAGGGFAEDEMVPEAGRRVLLAVFLPDGTLIGPEKVYLFAPGGRVATISMSPWLGSVRCETLTLVGLAAAEEEDLVAEPGEAEFAEPESVDGPGASMDEPGPTGDGS